MEALLRGRVNVRLAWRPITSSARAHGDNPWPHGHARVSVTCAPWILKNVKVQRASKMMWAEALRWGPILNDDSGGWFLITFPARGRTCSPAPEKLAHRLYGRALGKRKHFSQQIRNLSLLSSALAGPVQSLHGGGPKRNCRPQGLFDEIQLHRLPYAFSKAEQRTNESVLSSMAFLVLEGEKGDPVTGKWNYSTLGSQNLFKITLIFFHFFLPRPTIFLWHPSVRRTCLIGIAWYTFTLRTCAWWKAVETTRGNTKVN